MKSGSAAGMRVISVTVSESIWRIVDVTKYTGNQVIAAIQAIVNKNPKARATNGLYLRTCIIV